MSEYIVVFKGTGEPGGNHKGIITWTAFASKEAFEAWRKESASVQEVIEEGVVEERAIELVRSTAPAARLHAAISKVTYDDGSVDGDMLRYELRVLGYLSFD